MTQLAYMQLLHLSIPQIVLDVTALVVLFTDLALRRKSQRLRFTVAALLAFAGCVGAIFRLLVAQAPVNLFDGMFVANLLSSRVQIALLGLTIVTLLLSIESDFTEHVGEYVLLILLALTGMMFLVSSQNILTIFLSLELLSLALYALTAFDKRSSRSSEAALKYFLFGGMSAAFLLFGFSLLYGVSNSTNLAQIGAAIADQRYDAAWSLSELLQASLGSASRWRQAPFPLLGPGCVRRRADPCGRVHRVELKGGELLHILCADDCGLRHRCR